MSLPYGSETTRRTWVATSKDKALTHFIEAPVFSCCRFSTCPAPCRAEVTLFWWLGCLCLCFGHPGALTHPSLLEFPALQFTVQLQRWTIWAEPEFSWWPRQKSTELVPVKSEACALSTGMLQVDYWTVSSSLIALFEVTEFDQNFLNYAARGRHWVLEVSPHIIKGLKSFK